MQSEAEMQPHNDYELMSQTAAGDAEAFAELYDRLASRVFGLIVKVLGTRRGADDVLQEAFWKVWRTAGEYDPARSSPPVWIAMIARSMALDHRRHASRQAAHEDAARGTAASDAMPISPSSTTSHSAEIGIPTNGALSRLPADQREAIGLAFFRGLSHSQIAASQNLPVGTVKTRIRLGMKRLRELLADYYEVSPS
jgi:RNA polymerase sigma-70 factor (ECF subfamily)